MDEKDTTKLYYLADAVVSDPARAERHLKRAKLEEVDSIYLTAVSVLEDLVLPLGSEKNTSGLELAAQKLLDGATSQTPEIQEVGQAVLWAVKNRAEGARSGRRQSPDIEPEDLLANVY